MSIVFCPSPLWSNTSVALVPSLASFFALAVEDCRVGLLKLLEDSYGNYKSKGAFFCFNRWKSFIRTNVNWHWRSSERLADRPASLAQNARPHVTPKPTVPEYHFNFPYWFDTYSLRICFVCSLRWILALPSVFARQRLYLGQVIWL